MKEIVVLLHRLASRDMKQVMQDADFDCKYFSKAQAYRLFGRTNVDRWLREKLIETYNNKFNRQELEAVAATSNRRTYLPVADR